MAIGRPPVELGQGALSYLCYISGRYVHTSSKIQLSFYFRDTIYRVNPETEEASSSFYLRNCKTFSI